MTQISAPEETKVVQNSGGLEATLSYCKRTNNFAVFYRSAEMKYPHLAYAEVPEFPNEVAVYASLVPTFEPPAPQEEFEVLEEEEPE